MENLVKLLKNKKQTISSMESCTGGFFASEITNISGASEIFKLGLVTYSNEYKEYFGVSKQIIDEYTVYSNEVSRKMAKVCSNISNSDFGIGITGMLGTIDPSNPSKDINSIYVTVYRKENDNYFDFKLQAFGKTRSEKKKYIIDYLKGRLYEICEWEIRRIQ